MNFHPEITPITMAHEPVAANALADTSAWADLKDCNGLFIVVDHYTGGDTDLVLSVHEGDAASGTTDVANNFQIWTALDALNDPTLVRQADAKSYTIDTGVNTGSQKVIFYVSAAGRKRYIQLGASGGHADSIVSVTYIKDGARYQGSESY
jgi:hypothetical protein